jgi:phospholipid transport system substrate-binding protein
MITSFKGILLALVLVTAGLQPAAAAPLPPDKLVKQTIEEVLDIIRSDQKIQSGDVIRIAEVMEQKIAPHFDFPRMTRLAVGRAWRQATPEQRRDLVEQFRLLLIRSYASAFTMYKVIFVEYQPLNAASDDNHVIVGTLIRLPGGAQPITVDYDISLRDGAWKVFDVRIGGASLIINYRNVFAQEIQRGGIDGLLNSLIQKNTQDLAAAAGQQ